MLHRLLLTWDPPSVQLLVTGVVQQIVRAAQDYLQEKRNTLSKILKTQLALQSNLSNRVSYREKNSNTLEYGYTEEENAVYSTDTSDVFIILLADFLTLLRYSFSFSDHSSGYSFHVMVFTDFSQI